MPLKNAARRLSIKQKRKNLEARRIREGKLPTPRKNGRPKKTFKPDEVERLAALGCNDRDMAAGLLISEPTFRSRMKDDPEFAEAVERGRANGRINLRQHQWRHVEGEGGPAVNMAIFLGKNMLGQVDRPVETHSTVDVNIEISSASERIASKLDQLRERLLGSGQPSILPQVEILGDLAASPVDGEFVESGVVERPVEGDDRGLQKRPLDGGSGST